MTGRANFDEPHVVDLCKEVLGLPSQRKARFDWLFGDSSPSRPRGTLLQVDGCWPDLDLLVALQEEQYSRPSPFFDRRQTASGVGRGEQRRLHDERKRTLIGARGMQLVVIERSELEVRPKRIVRDRDRDVAVRARLA